MNNIETIIEFDHQVSTIVQKEYLKQAKISEKEFQNLVAPLKSKLLSYSHHDIDIKTGKIPFVIVVKSVFFSTELMFNKVIRDGKKGIVKLFPHEAVDFTPTSILKIPKKSVYVILDIDRGSKYLNITPKDALDDILNEKRSPLTIDEGVALMTHFPDFLQKNNCFSLLGSRHAGDKRVPAIWINGKKHPKLGWCWEGNPHTWLGSASCLNRI